VLSAFDTFIYLIQPRRFWLLEWGNQFYITHHRGRQRVFSYSALCHITFLEWRVGCEQAY
jgi:hypothetical protein